MIILGVFKEKAKEWGSATPCAGVIAWIEVELGSEILVPNGHLLFHFTNSALMSYFILFNLSINCTTKTMSFPQIYNRIYNGNICQPPLLSLKNRNVNQFSKVVLIALKPEQLI